MVLVPLPVNMQKDANQIQVDEVSPHKTTYIESNRKKVYKKLEHMGRGNFPEQNTNCLCSKIKNRKWDLIKLQNFCKAMDTVNRTKHNEQIGKKSFTNPTSDSRLISSIYKELKKLDPHRTK